jgi:hypothetical protein
LACVDGRAYIAAAKRKDRSRAGKIESAKKSSEAHYETHGRFFYLTEENILAPGAFEELEEEEQVLDPELILPDGITRQFALADLRAKSVLLTFDQPTTPATNGLTATAPAWVNGGSTNLTFDYPVFGTVIGGDSREVSQANTSPTDPSTHSQEALHSYSEELNFDLYLKDPDEMIDAETGGDLVHPDPNEILMSRPSYMEEVVDPENGWADYVLDLDGLGDSEYQISSWAKDDHTE